jgi:hypothetical protein
MISFGFLGDIITREDDPDFNSHEVEISLGYCRACRRNKPGILNEVINGFVCLKCGYPFENQPQEAVNIKRESIALQLFWRNKNI